MTKVDQFESVFRAADKEVYAFERVELGRVLLVRDVEGPAFDGFRDRVRAFLDVLGDGPQWVSPAPGSFATVQDLLGLVRAERPDLVVTYRNLKSEAWRWPYSLGEYVDVLTQIARCPVLVLPHPQAGRAYEHALRNTDVVMAITDHLAGDARLVNWAAHFTEPGGKLYLTHVEDQAVYERYLDAISKIPTLDTDIARESIRAQLLKEAKEYAQSCRSALLAAKVDVTAEPLVGMGHHLTEYRRLIEEHSVDLLVLNTKDEDQLAMHGLAYPLSVELRELPLLLL